MKRTLYGTRHVPGLFDDPQPEENPMYSLSVQRELDRLWWGAIIHAYRTGNESEAWTMYQDNVDLFLVQVQ